MARFDKLTKSVKDLSAALGEARSSGAGSNALSSNAISSQPLNPDAVAAALEQASRSSNSTMVNIAIRLAQLAQKNPQRAA
jgi:hypothetical protein